ncbi:ATP-binding protein [Fundidesulfovibrio soli]|uniref:ATP-binding protein n=1 Tax=Fundidesulfovibrio soli TaxID=2922716 RepID=UPI001FAEA967|nr:ATP-binding protein [Fundidesulfovibrio soli]
MDEYLPLSQLNYFRNEIGLDESRLAAIRPYAAMLTAHSEAAGSYLGELYRMVIPKPQMEIITEYFGGTLQDFWFRWYSRLWDRPWDEDFLAELWRQGVTSARMGIDLQYVMLGEVKSRQLFLRAIRDEVPMEMRAPVVLAVNDLLDLCLIVRSKGHVYHRSHVDQSLMQGIFHQTRNPLTVIGGMATRLARNADPAVRESAHAILDEALRLERMTRDISTLNSIGLSEPSIATLDASAMIGEALEGLRTGPLWPQGLTPETSLDPAHPTLQADPSLLREILKQVLVNALEAMPPEAPALRVATRVDAATPSHLSIVVSGPGALPRDQEVDALFLPFNSSKPQGTGFGLPIALLAARKCRGQVSLAQTGQDVACTVKLPLEPQTFYAGNPLRLDA